MGQIGTKLSGNNMKRSKLLFLLVILLSMTCYKSYAYDIEVKNADGVTIYYNYIQNNGRTELEVTYCNENLAGIYSDYTGNVVIPESVDYGRTYSVTSIGKSAFYESNLTSVTIPNSVTSIGDCAFIGCKSLISASIPSGVISIGDHAFSGCTSITSVTIPRSVVSIGLEAFDSRTLTVIEVEEGNSVYDSRNSCNAIIESANNILILGCKNTIIPNSVTSIGDYAFFGCALSSVNIPNGVASIGEYAFAGCSSMTSAIIPNSVTSIGQSAFNSSGLVSVVIGRGVTSIGNYAFAYNEGLAYVTVNSSPSTIGEDLFAYSSKIKEVVFDCENVTSLFKGITTIEKITFKDGVKEIGAGVFAGFTNITSISLPNSLTSIGESAFSRCTGLNSIDLPNSLISIGDYAFYGCSGLKSLVIPNSVSTIGQSAFGACNNLFSVTIGSGVTSIGSFAFIYNQTYFSSYVKKAIWLTNTPPNGYNNVGASVNYVSNDQYSSLSNTKEYKFLSSRFVVDGIVYVPVSPSERMCDAIDCVYNESAEIINIGEAVTNKGITLSVKKVNPYTCYGNNYIKEVKLSLDGELGDWAFSNCQALTSADISIMGDIGNRTFSDCSYLKTATIRNVGDIRECAFYNCESLLSVKIQNQGSIGNSAFYNCKAMETAEFGLKVTTIENNAFSYCSKLQNIEIPDAVTSIGSYAFQNCEAMTSAKIGNGVETVNGYSFSGCSSLNEIVIGSKVKVINQNAFEGCIALSSITIPQTVTNIQDYVFYNCTSLNEVNISDSNTELILGSNGNNPLFSSCPLKTIYIGRNIIYKTSSDYGYSPFYRNTSLKTVKITDKETDISENEFYGCTNLQSVTIGDGVTTIGSHAFSGCQSLKYFAFGSKVLNIGQEAFSDCTALTELSSKAYTPPVCGSQALDDINKWECKLIVPKDRALAYQDADQWKDFFFMEEGEPSYSIISGDANGDGKVDNSDINATIDYIMNGKTEGFIFDNADMNGDQKVNAADIVQILNIIKAQ